MAYFDLGQLSHAKLAELARGEGAVGVVQMGALEAHGPHLPIANDTLYIERLVRDAGQLMAFDVVACPSISGGLSHRHRRYPGTVVISPDALKSSILSMIATLVRAGFGRVLLVSGHGGNFPPMREAMLAARGIHPGAVIRGYGGFGRSFSEPLEDVALEAGFPLGNSEGHAGFWQTSLALHLFPELVGDYRSVVGYTAGEPGCWRILSSQGAHALHETGVIGNPSRANAELGRLGYERLVATFREWLSTAFHRPDDWRYRERDAATFDYIDPEDFVVTPRPGGPA